MALVYSTAHGRMCPECGKPKGQCACRREQAPPGDGNIRVGREVRKGAGVTVISGVPLAGEALQALAKELKARCGSGGTVKNGVIEIQGDHRDAVLEAFAKRGWKGKRVGG